MSLDLPNPKKGCHLTGFTKKCRKLVADGHCERWTNVQGIHPQTGERLNRWACIDDHTTLLMIENSKLLNEVGAAIESFRNNVMAQNDKMLSTMRRAQGMPGVQLLEVPYQPRVNHTALPKKENDNGNL